MRCVIARFDFDARLVVACKERAQCTPACQYQAATFILDARRECRDEADHLNVVAVPLLAIDHQCAAFEGLASPARSYSRHDGHDAIRRPVRSREACLVSRPAARPVALTQFQFCKVYCGCCCRWIQFERTFIESTRGIVRAEPGAWIEPDIATVVDVASRPFPLANGAVFVTGNPDTGQRAAIENSTGVVEVNFIRVQIRCNYAHGSLTGGQQLRGLGCFAVAGLRVESCTVLNLPNTGIVAQDCTDETLTGNRSNGNGFGPPASTVATKNGISVSGLILHTPRLANSYSTVVTSNICNYNCDEGIQYGLQCGIVLASNVTVGNGDLGIEGDTAFSTSKTAADLGFEIPSQTILVGNYIDGRKSDGTLGMGGIGFSAGNEGVCLIASNIVRYVAGKIGIAASQNSGGFVTLESNVLDNCDPGANQHQIQVRAQWVKLANNVAIRPGASNSHCFAYLYDTVQTALLDGNYADPMASNFIRIAPNGGKLNLVRASRNTSLGSAADAIIIAPVNACAIGNVHLDSNALLNVNASGASDKRAITIAAPNASTSVTLSKLTVRGQTVTYAAPTLYAVGLVNMQAGSITTADINGNDFDTPTMPYGTTGAREVFRVKSTGVALPSVGYQLNAVSASQTAGFNNTFFVDQSDSLLKFRDASGAIKTISLT